MKRNRLTRLLAAVLGALFVIAWAGPAVAFYSGPEDSGYNRDTGAGTMDKARTGECCDEMLQLFEVPEDLWPHEGPSEGADNTTGQGDQDRERDPGMHE